MGIMLIRVFVCRGPSLSSPILLFFSANEQLSMKRKRSRDDDKAGFFYKLVFAPSLKKKLSWIPSRLRDRKWRRGALES